MIHNARRLWSQQIKLVFSHHPLDSLSYGYLSSSYFLIKLCGLYGTRSVARAAQQGLLWDHVGHVRPADLDAPLPRLEERPPALAAALGVEVALVGVDVVVPPLENVLAFLSSSS